MQRIAESLKRLTAKWWRGSSVASFVVSGFVVLAVLGVAGIVYIRSTGQREAVRDAKVLTRIAGEGIVAPLLGDGILARNSATFAAVDAAVRERVLHDPIVRVKVWSSTGEILYSDDERLIGKTFPLGADELEILHGGGCARASVSVRICCCGPSRPPTSSGAASPATSMTASCRASPESPTRCRPRPSGTQAPPSESR